MQYNIFVKTFALAAVCSAASIPTTKRDNDGGFSIPGFSIPGLTMGSGTKSSQPFHKVVTFQLTGKQFQFWPPEACKVDIALDYSYNQGTIEGIPIGTVSAEAQLIKTTYKTSSRMF